MAERFISKRLAFPAGSQRSFLVACTQGLGLTHVATAELLSVSSRTLTDWKREKFLLPLTAAKKLAQGAGIPIPKHAQIREPYWYTTHSSSAGGIAVYKKYGHVGGDPERRKQKWYAWWKREGRFKPHPIINVALPIKKPRNSAELAEFVGVVLGDGGISKRQVVITLNHRDDSAYGIYVISLIKKLFGVRPKIYYDSKDSVDNIVVSRSELVKFCTDALGLKIGSKVRQQVGVPSWVKRNRKFLIACVRGLIDTDGSVFTHRYRVNGKWYSYKKLAFANRSRPLLRSVFNIMKSIGLQPRLTDGVDVRLDSIADMRRYFIIVGSHNPKHLKHYQD